MGYSINAKNLMLAAFAEATPWVTLHTATTLSSGAAVGADQIAVAHSVEAGATVIINPQQPNSETLSVLEVAGAGPYTLTLSGNLANAHEVGEFVSYTPHQTVGPKEPTGGNPAFVRVGQSWNDPVDGILDSSNMPELNVAEGVPLTHVVWMASDSGNTIRAWATIPLTMYDSQSVFRLRDADLDLNLEGGI